MDYKKSSESKNVMKLKKCMKSSKCFKKIAIFLLINTFLLPLSFDSSICISQDEVSITAQVQGNGNQNTNQGGGGGGGSSAPGPSITTINFSGKAYPNRLVTLLKGAQIIATTYAGSNANFEISYTGLSSGTHQFSLYSEDYLGTTSNIISFPISISQGVIITVSGIFIPPTIDVDLSQVKKGDNITILGQSKPQAEISIVVNSPQEFFVQTTADDDGLYSSTFDSSLLEFGQHFTKSKSIYQQEISGYSKSVSFLVSQQSIPKQGGISQGDVNSDNKVDLVDFSILAYWYNRSEPPENTDLNDDNLINLIDFSILAYYWTG